MLQYVRVWCDDDIYHSQTVADGYGIWEEGHAAVSEQDDVLAVSIKIALPITGLADERKLREGVQDRGADEAVYEVGADKSWEHSPQNHLHH